MTDDQNSSEAADDADDFVPEETGLARVFTPKDFTPAEEKAPTFGSNRHGLDKPQPGASATGEGRPPT